MDFRKKYDSVREQMLRTYDLNLEKASATAKALKNVNKQTLLPVRER